MEKVPYEWYQPGPNTIWSDAEVCKNIGHLYLVQKQQSTLVSSIRLNHFGLKKCLQPDQAFMEFKKKWVNTFYAERRSWTLHLHTMDLITDTTVHIMESLKNIQEGSVLDAPERD